MRIGVDIDDTVTKTTEAMKGFFAREEIASKIVDVFHMTDEEKEFAYPLCYQEVVKNALLKEEVSSVLKRLKQQGHLLYFITARNEKYMSNLMMEIKKYFKKHQIPYDGIFINQEKKSFACKKYKIDIMIDDDVEVCADLEKNHIPFLLFASETNKESTYCKCYHWLEVESYIEKMEEQNE